MNSDRNMQDNYPGKQKEIGRQYHEGGVITSKALRRQAAERVNMLGIHRIDCDRSRTHAWTVTLTRRKRTFSAYFSDGLYGGHEAALEAAIKHRDALVEKFPPYSLKKYCSIRKKNNTSGVVGVSRHVVVNKRGDQTAAFWVATWPSGPYKVKQQKFYVSKYGEEGAREKAIKARRDAITRLEGVFDPGAGKVTKM